MKIQVIVAATALLVGVAATGPAFGQTADDQSKMSGMKMTGTKMSHDQAMAALAKMSTDDKATMVDKMSPQAKADMFDKMPMNKKMSMMNANSSMHKGGTADTMGKMDKDK